MTSSSKDFSRLAKYLYYGIRNRVIKPFFSIFPRQSHSASSPEEFFLEELARCKNADSKRYYEYSGTTAIADSQASHRAKIIMHAHAIEKGLALSDPKPGFGRYHRKPLITFMESYIKRYGVDRFIAQNAEILSAYVKFHENGGDPSNEVLPPFRKLLERINSEWTESKIGFQATLPCSRSELIKKASIDIDSFYQSRHSIRHFTGEKVSDEIIDDCIRLAQRTPSVCNRQGWAVFVFSDSEKKKTILKHQNGNRGFGHLSSHVLLVTADFSCFFGSSERNQPFIDGGMFAMSLIYALHAKGVGTCALNTCLLPEKEDSLRVDASLPQEHVPIMMIAVGEVPEAFSVARSVRRKFSECVFKV